MQQDRKKWLRDAKIRLAVTVLGVIAAIVAPVAVGFGFDLWAGLGLLAAEVLACIAGSLILKKKKEEDEDGD